MDFQKLKQSLLGQNRGEIVEYSNEDLSYQISFMLKKARLVKGLTQVELANKIGTKQESIARAENGNGLPSLTFLVKIANAFNAKLIMPIFDFLALDSDLDFYNIRNQVYDTKMTIINAHEVTDEDAEIGYGAMSAMSISSNDFRNYKQEIVN